MHPVYVIRPEQEADFSSVRALNDTAFGRPEEGRLVDAVRRRDEPTFGLVATVEESSRTDEAGRIVGYVLFSPVSIESTERPCRAIGLGPMAVHPDHQRAGVGRELVEAGLARCREEGYQLVVVLGLPTYYGSFGFVMAASRGLHWEHEMPGDPFMVLELEPGALDGVSGVVRYLPEFLTA